MKPLVNEIENMLLKNKKQEARDWTGWGSLSADKKFLKLRIHYHMIGCLVDELTVFNLRVTQKNLTINGNSTHRIRIQTRAFVEVHETVQYQGITLIANVPGTILDFEFAMTIAQINFIFQPSPLTSSKVELVAYFSSGAVKVFMIEKNRHHGNIKTYSAHLTKCCE
jgi:hypothetical protein